MDVHGYPWIPWINDHNLEPNHYQRSFRGNPFCHQMVRRLSWEDFNQTNIHDLVMRVFANFEKLGLLLSACMYWVFLVLFLEGPWTTKNNFEGNWWLQDFGGHSMLSGFSRNPQIRENQFSKWRPWEFSMKLCATDAQSLVLKLSLSICMCWY